MAKKSTKNTQKPDEVDKIQAISAGTPESLDGSLPSPRERREYTDRDKVQFAEALYMCAGNIAEAGRVVNIPHSTAYQWVSSDWWEGFTSRLKLVKETELDAGYTNIINLATNKIIDRIKNGDFHYNSKGECSRREISGKDLAVIQAIAFEKRQILRGQPVKIVKSATDLEQRKALAEQLAAEGAKVINGIADVSYSDIAKGQPANKVDDNQQSPNNSESPTTIDKPEDRPSINDNGAASE